ncbi:MAG TPA: GNAT family N-acetyltransferase [Candidatus Acidoferrum sp.]|jgi:GNAT superfamily N-acetyltransferase
MHRKITCCHVAEIAVKSDFQNRGIGRRLLHEGEDWGRAHGAQFASLEFHASNTLAGRFYQHYMGYSVASVTAKASLESVIWRVECMANLLVTNNIIIRTAAVTEQEALQALQLRASLTNDGDRQALLANPDAINIPLEQLAAGRVFVSELNSVTVGFSAIEARGDGQIELDALFVEPNIRRRGVGRLMIEYCADVARKQGSTALHVTGNPHAENFYLACRFKQIGTTQTRFGIGLLLRREL